jgi:GTP cyclohydrolase I
MVTSVNRQVTEDEAKEAIRTLIAYIGEDPEREALKSTPQRVIEGYKELFWGYEINPTQLVFSLLEDSVSNDIIMLKDIEFVSYCEHHVLPFIGNVHIAYAPNEKVIGIGKLAQVVDAYAHRLQIQERLTMEIAKTLYNTLQAKAVGVVVEACHHCLSERGSHKKGAQLITTKMLGDPLVIADLKQLLLRG